MNPPGRRRGIVAILSIVVAAIVLIVHWPVLSARAISYDDQYYLSQNPLVQNPSWASVTRVFGEVFDPSVPGYYEPAAAISLMPDYARGGSVDNLRPFHQTSLCLHVLNSVAIVVLIYLLFDEAYVAALAGLLFGVHPMTVEPIALVAQRKVLLASFFSLWSLVLYVRYARQGGRASYVGAMVLYVLALLSKPTSTPLPVLLLLLDFWPLRRLSRRAVLEKIPFFLVGGLSAVVTVVSCGRTAGITIHTDSSAAKSLLGAVYLVVFYVSKIIWPAKLSSDYPLPEPFALSNPVVVVFVVVACALAAAVAVSLRWTRAIAAGGLFYLFGILPVLGFVGYTWVTASDKHVYLPAVGLLLPLSYWACRLWCGEPDAPSAGVRRSGIVVLAIGLAGAGAIATRHYLYYWQDTERLFQRMIALAPKSPYPYSGLASALAGEGRNDEAVALCARALDLKPDFADAHINIGNALIATGKLADAVSHYKEAARLLPNDAVAHYDLANALNQLGQFDEAVAQWNRALELKPDFADAHANLGGALLERGQTAAAIDQCQLALRASPSHVPAHLNLALALRQLGRYDEAIEHCRQVLRIYPNHPTAMAQFEAATARGAATTRTGK